MVLTLLFAPPEDGRNLEGPDILERKIRRVFNESSEEKPWRQLIVETFS